MGSTKVQKVMESLEFLEHPTKPTSMQILKIMKKHDCCQKTVYIGISKLKERYKNLTKYYNDVNRLSTLALYYYSAIEWLLKRIPEELGLPSSTLTKFDSWRREIHKLRKDYQLDAIDGLDGSELLMMIKGIQLEKLKVLFGEG